VTPPQWGRGSDAPFQSIPELRGEVVDMKVMIDREGCIECGVCEQTCEDVFILDTGEKASIVEKYRKSSRAVGEIPDSLIDCASSAASSCPVQVITTE